MKKVAAVMLAVPVFVVLLSQAAVAGTSFSVSVSSPGVHFEAASVRPSPHHVWVDGCHRWNGHHRVWVPGYWKRAHHVRTVYVPAHRRTYQDCRYDRYRDDSRHERSGGQYHDQRNERYGRDGGDRGGYQRDSSRWN